MKVRFTIEVDVNAILYRRELTDVKCGEIGKDLGGLAREEILYNTGRWGGCGIKKVTLVSYEDDV